MFEDKTLKCVECGNEFVFSASEQEFYAEKGFTNEPKRCSSCRAARKARMNGTQPRECLRQFVRTAVKRRKFRSVLRKIARFIALTASINVKQDMITNKFL